MARPVSRGSFSQVCPRQTPTPANPSSCRKIKGEAALYDLFDFLQLWLSIEPTTPDAQGQAEQPYRKQKADHQGNKPRHTPRPDRSDQSAADRGQPEGRSGDQGKTPKLDRPRHPAKVSHQERALYHPGGDGTSECYPAETALRYGTELIRFVASCLARTWNAIKRIVQVMPRRRTRGLPRGRENQRVPYCNEMVRNCRTVYATVAGRFFS